MPERRVRKSEDHVSLWMALRLPLCAHRALPGRRLRGRWASASARSGRLPTRFHKLCHRARLQLQCVQGGFSASGAFRNQKVIESAFGKAHRAHGPLGATAGNMSQFQQFTRRSRAMSFVISIVTPAFAVVGALVGAFISYRATERSSRNSLKAESIGNVTSPFMPATEGRLPHSAITDPPRISA